MSNNDSDASHQLTRAHKNQSSWAPTATQSRSGRTIKPKTYDDAYQKPVKQPSSRGTQPEHRNGGLAGATGSGGSILAQKGHASASDNFVANDGSSNPNNVGASGRKRSVRMAPVGTTVLPPTNDVPVNMLSQNPLDAVDNQSLLPNSDTTGLLPPISATVDNSDGGFKFKIRLPRPDDDTTANASGADVEESGDDYSSAQDEITEDPATATDTTYSATDAESSPRAQSLMSESRRDTTFTTSSGVDPLTDAVSAEVTGFSDIGGGTPSPEPPQQFYAPVTVPETNTAAAPPASAPPVNTRARREIKAPKFFDDRMTEMAERHRKPVKLKLRLPKLTDVAANSTMANLNSGGTAAEHQSSLRRKKTAATVAESTDSSSFATPSEGGSSEGDENPRRSGYGYDTVAANANNRYGLSNTNSRKSRANTNKRHSDRNRNGAQERLSDDDDASAADDDARESDSTISPDRRNSYYQPSTAHGHHRASAPNEAAFTSATNVADDPFGDFGLLAEPSNRNMQFGSNPHGGRANVTRHNPYHDNTAPGRSTGLHGETGASQPSQADFIHQALSWASTSHSTAASTALPSSAASSTSVHDPVSRSAGLPPFQRDLNPAAAGAHTPLDTHTSPPTISSSTSSTANIARHQHMQEQEPHDEAAVRLQEMTQIIAAETGGLVGGAVPSPDDPVNRMINMQSGTSGNDVLENADGGTGGTSEPGVDHVPTEQELQEALNEVMAEMENSGYDFLNQLSGGPQQMDAILSGNATNPHHVVTEAGGMVSSSSQGETVSSGVVAPVIATTAIAGMSTSLVSSLAPGVVSAGMPGLVIPVTNLPHHAAALHPQQPAWNVGAPSALSGAGNMLQPGLLAQYGNLVMPASSATTLRLGGQHQVMGQLPPYGGVSYVLAPPATHNMYSGGGMTSALNATSSTTSLMDEDGGRLAIDTGDDHLKPNGHSHNMANKISSSNRQQQQQQHLYGQPHVADNCIVEDDGGEAAYQREVEAEREAYENQESGDLDPFGYDDGAADALAQSSAFKPIPRYARRGPYNKRKNAGVTADTAVGCGYVDNSGTADVNDLSRDGVGDDSYGGDYVDDGSGPNLEQLAVMLDTLPDADRIVARMILMDDVPPEQVRMLARQLDSDRLAREMNSEGILRQQAEEMRAKRRQSISGALMYADAKFEEVQQHNRDTNQTTAQTKIANELKDAYNKLTPDQQAPYEMMAQEVRQGVRGLPARVLRNFHYLTGIGMLEHLSNRVYAVDRQHVVKMWRKITKKSRHALAELAHVIEEALDKFLAEEDALGYQQQREQLANAASASDAVTSSVAPAGVPPISSGGSKPFNSSQEVLSEGTSAQSAAVSSVGQPPFSDATSKHQAAAAALSPKRSVAPQTTSGKKEIFQQGKTTPAAPTGASAITKPPVEKPKPVERPRGVTLLNLDERVNEQRSFNKLQAAYRDGATGSRDNTVPCSLACGAHFPVPAAPATAGSAAANVASSSGVTTTSEDSGIAHMDEVDSEAEFEDTAASQWVTHPYEPLVMPLPAHVPLNAADECKPTAFAYAGLFQHAAHRTQQVASSLAMEQQKAFEHLGSSRSYRTRNSTTPNPAKPERKLHIANEHLMDSILNASCSIFAGALAQISGTNPNTGVPLMKFMANANVNDKDLPVAEAEKTTSDDDVGKEKQLAHKLALENQGECILASVETLHAVMGADVKSDQLRATRVLAAQREADRKREAQERAAAVSYAQQHGAEHSLNRGQRIGPGGVFGKMLNGRNAPYSQLVTPGGLAGANIRSSGGQLFNSNNRGIDGSSAKRRATDFASGIAGFKRPRYTIGDNDDSDDYDDYADDADYKGPRGSRLRGRDPSQLDEDYSTDDELADNEEEAEHIQYGTWRRHQDEHFNSQKQVRMDDAASGMADKDRQLAGPHTGAPRLRTSFLQQQRPPPVSSNKNRSYTLSKTADDEAMNEGDDSTPSRVYLSGSKNYSGMMSRQRLSALGSGQPTSQFLSRQNINFSNLNDKQSQQSPQGPGVAFSRTPRTTVLLQRGFLGALPPGTAAVNTPQQRPKAPTDAMSKGGDITSPATASGLPAGMLMETNDSSAVPLPAPVANVEYMARPAPVVAEQQLSPADDQFDNGLAEQYDNVDAETRNAKKTQQKLTIPSLTTGYVLAKNQKKLAPVARVSQPQSVMLSQGPGQPPRLFGKTSISSTPPVTAVVAQNVAKGFSTGAVGKETPRQSIFGVRQAKPALPAQNNVVAVKAVTTRKGVFGGIFKRTTTPAAIDVEKSQQKLNSAPPKKLAVAPVAKLPQEQRHPPSVRPANRYETQIETDEFGDEYDEEASGYSDDYEFAEADDSKRNKPDRSGPSSFDDDIEVDEDYAGSPSGLDGGAGKVVGGRDVVPKYNDDPPPATQSNKFSSSMKKGSALAKVQPSSTQLSQKPKAAFGFVMEPPPHVALSQQPPFPSQSRPTVVPAAPATKSQVFGPSKAVFAQKTQAKHSVFGSRLGR